MLLRGVYAVVSLRGWSQANKLDHASYTVSAMPDGTQGDKLLAYWQFLLMDDQSLKGGALEEDKVKELLGTAIRLRWLYSTPKLSFFQGTLPEQLIGMFMKCYNCLDRQGRLLLFRSLTRHFGVQHKDVEAAVKAWIEVQDQVMGEQGCDALSKASQRLAAASKPLYSQLLVPISQQPSGIKFLVDMRADLLDCMREAPSGSAPLRTLSTTLRNSLAEWFSVGLLQLRRLTWEESSAALLEKVMKYEAVHRMEGWGDLQRRLGPCRRVFAFFHQAMPQEPLVVLHTALVQGPPPSSLQHVLRGEGECKDGPTTAVFYSISSTQTGLSGVDLGNFLIKQVAHSLLHELPSLTTLCTLSPVPGFAPWLDMRIAAALKGVGAGGALLRGEEIASLAPFAEGQLQEEVVSGLAAAGEADPHGAALLLSWCLKGGKWVDHPPLEAALRPVLLRLATTYLVHEKRRGLALDPVANFHLRNGAELWRVNWRSDPSPAGLARSYGIMVNYIYTLDEVASNNRKYLVDSQVVASQEVLQWVGGADSSSPPAGHAMGQEGGATKIERSAKPTVPCLAGGCFVSSNLWHCSTGMWCCTASAEVSST